MTDRFGKRKSKQFRDAQISRDILRYGGAVLRSGEFRKSVFETHHLRGSVYEHSLTVCITAAKLCRFLQRKGFRVNEKDLIQASLCHDLGMIGRQDKYRKRTEAWRSHADDSAVIAHNLIPDLSKNAEALIRSHMWPVSGPAPRSREAFILNAADKYASVADWVFYFTGKRTGEAIRKKLEQE